MRLWFGVIVIAALTFGAAAKDYPANEQPLYGGITKTPEMLQADQQFIDVILKQGYSRAQGSDKAVETGWIYLRRGDLATAMKRFNQAWLLDPDNGDAFHGFAATVMSRDQDAGAADALFKLGIAKSRQKPGIFLDYGRFLLMMKRSAEAVPVLQKAVSFADMGPEGEALLTVALYQSGDQKAGCAELAKVKIDIQQKPVADLLHRIVGNCRSAP